MENVISERDAALARLDEVVAARAPWSVILGRGEILRIIDLEGRQSVDTLIYNAHDTAERYSAQDTVRVNGSPYISQGSRLISNAGGVLATIVADTCGRHDTSAGACSCESNSVRFGHHTRYMHACRENFVVAAAKHGLTKRDLVSNINFFMNVPIMPDGAIAIDDGVAVAGSLVELRADMDVIVLVSNCPQVNNPCNGFDPTPVRMVIWPPDDG
jgi:uncharacterized protein